VPGIAVEGVSVRFDLVVLARWIDEPRFRVEHVPASVFDFGEQVVSADAKPARLGRLRTDRRKRPGRPSRFRKRPRHVNPLRWDVEQDRRMGARLDDAANSLEKRLVERHLLLHVLVRLGLPGGDEQNLANSMAPDVVEDSVIERGDITSQT
jgi:hypothetical protein